MYSNYTCPPSLSCLSHMCLHAPCPFSKTAVLRCAVPVLCCVCATLHTVPVLRCELCAVSCAQFFPHGTPQTEAEARAGLMQVSLHQHMHMEFVRARHLHELQLHMCLACTCIWHAYGMHIRLDSSMRYTLVPSQPGGHA